MAAKPIAADPRQLNETRLSADGFEVEVGVLDPERWAEVLDLFHDASIYQTWAYGAVRWGGSNLHHILLRHEGEVVAAAQAQIFRLPLGVAGIAYVNYGPMWRRRDRDEDPAVLRRMVQALRREFVDNRRLLLRLQPYEYESESGELKQGICGEGLDWKESPFRTLLLDMAPDLDALEMNLDRRWRNHLRKARKAGLEVTADGSDAAFDVALDLHREMRERKNFVAFADLNEFRKMQGMLPERHQLDLMICRKDSKPVAFLLCSAVGSTGVSLLAATDPQGRRDNASYLLYWEMLEEYKRRGCRTFDVGGINPERNPGVYHFKAGFAGKSAIDLRRLGNFDDTTHSFQAFMFSMAEKARETVRDLKRVAAERKTGNGSDSDEGQG